MVCKNIGNQRNVCNRLHAVCDPVLYFLLPLTAVDDIGTGVSTSKRRHADLPLKVSLVSGRSPAHKTVPTLLLSNIMTAPSSVPVGHLVREAQGGVVLPPSPGKFACQT